MKLNDSDYPSPCCIELALLMPITVVVGVIRLAVSPSYRKVYRARQRQQRSVKKEKDDE